MILPAGSRECPSISLWLQFLSTVSCSLSAPWVSVFPMLYPWGSRARADWSGSPVHRARRGGWGGAPAPWPGRDPIGQRQFPELALTSCSRFALCQGRKRLPLSSRKVLSTADAFAGQGGHQERRPEDVKTENQKTRKAFLTGRCPDVPSDGTARSGPAPLQMASSPRATFRASAGRPDGPLEVGQARRLLSRSQRAVGSACSRVSVWTPLKISVCTVRSQTPACTLAHRLWKGTALCPAGVADLQQNKACLQSYLFNCKELGKCKCLLFHLSNTICYYNTKLYNVLM